MNFLTLNVCGIRGVDKHSWLQRIERENKNHLYGYTGNTIWDVIEFRCTRYDNSQFEYEVINARG